MVSLVSPFKSLDNLNLDLYHYKQRVQETGTKTDLVEINFS